MSKIKKTQFDISELIENGEILNELDLERVMIAERKLRVIAKENSKFKSTRKKLRDLIEQYESKNWSADSNITDKKIQESDVAELIAKWLKITDEDNKANDFYHAKLFGEGRTVEYSIDGLCNSHCKLTEWTNGEGYDIRFDTDEEDTKTISLHTDELDVLFACLNHFKYFEV
jgi:hypothetical protein